MRTRIVVLTALLLALVAVPAAADDLTVEVAMGARGAVPVDTAFDVTVTAASTRLWEGWVVVEASTLRFGVPLELPAGSSKETTVRVPPLPAGTTVRVFLESSDGTRSPIQRFGQGDEDGSVWVAAYGVSASDLDAISRARSVPSDTTPRVDEVADVDLADLSGFGYLVVGVELPAGAVDDVARWVEQGGRLVGPALATAAVAAGADTELAGLAVTLLGRGEVIATSADPVDWDTVLRDPGIVSFGNTTGFSEPYSALLGTAVGVGGSPLGTMPGLLPGLALYVVLAGPVNLLVLGRLRKRHLAWVTIPVISMVAVGVLWLLGPRQHRVDITAAEVVIGADHHTVWSAMAAGDGVYHMEPDAALVAGLGPRRADVSSRSDGSVALDLSTGQPTGVYSWRAGVPAIEASVSEGRWTVTNVSDTTVNLWGVAERERLHYSSQPLAPGESGLLTQSLPTDDPWTPRLQQVIWNTDIANDPRGWQVYEPLLGATESFTNGLDAFAWGLTDSEGIPLVVDGRPRSVDSVRMVVTPLDHGVGIGGGLAAVVDHEGVNADPGSGMFYGSGSVVLGYRVDPATVSLDVAFQDWGMPVADGIEIFDFITGTFEPVVDMEVADAADNVAGSGDVYLRLTVVESEVWPRMIQLEARS